MNDRHLFGSPSMDGTEMYIKNLECDNLSSREKDLIIGNIRSFASWVRKQTYRAKKIFPDDAKWLKCNATCIRGHNFEWEYAEKLGGYSDFRICPKCPQKSVWIFEKESRNIFEKKREKWFNKLEELGKALYDEASMIVCPGTGSILPYENIRCWMTFRTIAANVARREIDVRVKELEWCKDVLANSESQKDIINTRIDQINSMEIL